MPCTLIPGTSPLAIALSFSYLFSRYASVEALVRILGLTEEPVATPLAEEDDPGLDLREAK